VGGPSSWGEAERWALSQLQAGRVADFNSYLGVLDPANSTDWQLTRGISGTFLNAMLGDPERARGLGRVGLRLNGAWFYDAVDLENARLTCRLIIEQSRFELPVSMSGLRSTDDLSFRGSVFAASLEMNRGRVDGLFDCGNAHFAGKVSCRGTVIAGQLKLSRCVAEEIDFAGAKVGADAEMFGLECRGHLNLHALITGGALHLHMGSKLHGVDLKRAVIGDHLNLDAVTSTGMVDMEAITVHTDIFCQGGHFDAMALIGAKVGGQLSLCDSEWTGDFDLDSVRISADFLAGQNCHFRSVDLTGASVEGQLDLDGSIISGDLILQRARVGLDCFLRGTRVGSMDFQSATLEAGMEAPELHVTGGTNLNGLAAGSTIDFSGAQFGAPLTMTRLKCSGTLLLKGAKMTQLRIRQATIDGELNCTSASIAESADLPELTVGSDITLSGLTSPSVVCLDRARCAGSVRVRDATVGGLTLQFAHIGGLLDFSKTLINGVLDLEMIDVGENVFLQDGIFIEKVLVRDAKIGGTVVVRRTTLNGLVNMSGLRAGFVWLNDGARFLGPVQLTDARIEQNVDLARATFYDALDLSETTVNAALIVTSSDGISCAWDGRAHLNLRGTSIGNLQTAMLTMGNWPCRMSLDGFSYARIVDPTKQLSKRGEFGLETESWLKAWLAKNEGISLQPYQQLAAVLVRQGAAHAADRVLYAGKERQREHARGIRRLGYELLRGSIGYGIGRRYFRSLFWVIGLTVIGGFVFQAQVFHHWPTAGGAFLFSFDQLLPIVNVAPGADDIAKSLRGWQQFYLAFHRAVGFLLGSFVVAGLSGITQK
jgi:hypothetical protein